MSEATLVPLSLSSPVTDDPSEQPELGRKKKSKVRSAWISFMGRIVAQLFGAIATVTLGFQVVQSYLPPPPTSSSAAVAGTDRASALAPARPNGVVTLAVLPLANYSGDVRRDAFSNGLTEALIAEFAQLPGLQVTSRTSSMHAQEQGGLLPVIARQLGVNFVLEGSVVTAGDRVRITAQLIDAATDLHVWTRVYEPQGGDVLELHSALSTAIVRDVRAAVLSAMPPDVPATAIGRSPSYK